MPLTLYTEIQYNFEKNRFYLNQVIPVGIKNFYFITGSLIEGHNDGQKANKPLLK